MIAAASSVPARFVLEHGPCVTSILNASRARSCAACTAAEAFELAREYPPDLMRIVREGLEKEDPWLGAA